VDSRTLNYALIESYHESLPKGRYPLAFVFFECDPAAVDVNVHPAKREIRFRSEPQVRGFVIRAVLERLRTANSSLADRGLRPADSPEAGRTPPAIHRADLTAATARLGLAALPVITAPVTSVPAAPQTANFIPPPEASGQPPSALRQPPPDQPPAERSPLPGPAWRFVGLAHGNYALFETSSGLVLLDRRSAHERVWFERLREQFRAGAVPSQRLLLPLPVELDAIAAALLLDRLTFLHAHGFEIGEFGRNFFRIEAIPVWMEPSDAEPFLRDMLGAFREGIFPDAQTDLAHDALAQLAATKAVRLPETAGETELRALVAQLFATRTPLTSPAGRPTYIELNHGELARRFQK
jgi:DNA mismatch repair protein MutL